MGIEIVNEKKDWNKFIVENEGSFLQSFEWGEFQRQFAPKVLRFEIVQNGRKILQAQIIKDRIIIFNYFYIPYGPVFDKLASPEEKKEAFGLLLEEVGKLTKTEKAVFLKIEPFLPLPESDKFRLVISPKRIQPQKTMIINIDKPKEELLRNMRKRTRYNIKLAGKMGLEIKVSDGYTKVFYDLLKKTKIRQGFVSFREDHYKKIFDVASKDFKVKMFLVEYQKKVIVASVIIFFGKRITSLHSGSDYKYRALKGPEFKHWEAINSGKELGYKIYDFWGIDEKRYPGVTSFKRGFDGEEIEYPQGVDFVLNSSFYRIYTLLRKIKHILNHG